MRLVVAVTSGASALGIIVRLKVYKLKVEPTPEPTLSRDF